LKPAWQIFSGTFSGKKIPEIGKPKQNYFFRKTGFKGLTFLRFYPTVFTFKKLTFQEISSGNYYSV